MRRYLIYDAGCSACERIAEEIGTITGSKLELISIWAPEATALLDEALPEGWGIAPYLVVSERGRVRAWTGVAAAARLALLAGPRKVWRLWRVARRYGISLPIGARPATDQGVTRRSFLKLSAALATALAGLGLRPSAARAACDNPCGCVNCYRVTICELLTGCSPCQFCRCDGYNCYDARTGEFCWFEYRNCCCGGNCC